MPKRRRIALKKCLLCLRTPDSYVSGLYSEEKKGKSPAAATERHQDLAKNAVFESTQGFDRLSPILRYLRTNGLAFRQSQPERDGDGERKQKRHSGSGVFGVGAQIPRAFVSPCGCCASLRPPHPITQAHASAVFVSAQRFRSGDVIAVLRRQVPITPPSFLRTTTVAERGRPSAF